MLLSYASFKNRHLEILVRKYYGKPDSMIQEIVKMLSFLYPHPPRECGCIKSLVYFCLWKEYVFLYNIKAQWVQGVPSVCS